MYRFSSILGLFHAFIKFSIHSLKKYALRRPAHKHLHVVSMFFNICRRPPKLGLHKYGYSLLTLTDNAAIPAGQVVYDVAYSVGVAEGWSPQVSHSLPIDTPSACCYAPRINLDLSC